MWSCVACPPRCRGSGISGCLLPDGWLAVGSLGWVPHWNPFHLPLGYSVLAFCSWILPHPHSLLGKLLSFPLVFVWMVHVPGIHCACCCPSQHLVCAAVGTWGEPCVPETPMAAPTGGTRGRGMFLSEFSSAIDFLSGKLANTFWLSVF